MDTASGEGDVEHQGRVAGCVHESPEGLGKPGLGRAGGSRRSIRRLVHVALHGQQMHRKALRDKAFELCLASVGRRHRDADEQAGLVATQPDGPVAAVLTQPEHRISTVPVGEELLGADLRGVHADEEGGLVTVVRERVTEGVIQALVESVAALRMDGHVLRQPTRRWPVPGKDRARPSGPRRGEGVADGRRRERCSLAR